jgi:hypothetical protein
MHAVMDERWIWGIDLTEIEAHLLKEKVAGAVWSRTVILVPMAEIRAEEQAEAREHFELFGVRAVREPGEAMRRHRKLYDNLDQRRLVINLISHDNGVGLTQDVRLLRALFEGQGHEVRYTEWRDGSGQADVNFHIELYDPKHLRSARSHVGLFNLEWFDKGQISTMACMSQLWAKSGEALRIYETLGQGLWPAHYTGFLSRDMYRPGVAKEPVCIHVRGKASQKATDLVLEAWRRHGDDLPRLIVTSADEFDGWRRTHPTRVDMQFGHKSEAELAALMTACRFHICPSETEGWGHYIAEALSCKAVVVTVDGSPMNEHVRPEFGVLLPAATHASGLVTRHRVDPDRLALEVQQMSLWSNNVLDTLGNRARSHWESRQAAFAKKALALLSHL